MSQAMTAPSWETGPEAVLGLENHSSPNLGKGRGEAEEMIGAFHFAALKPKVGARVGDLGLI